MQDVERILYNNLGELDTASIINVLRNNLFSLFEHFKTIVNEDAIESILFSLSKASKQDINKTLKRIENNFYAGYRKITNKIATDESFTLDDAEKIIDEINTNNISINFVDDYVAKLVKKLEEIIYFINEPELKEDFNHAFERYKNGLKGEFDNYFKVVKKRLLIFISSKYYKRNYGFDGASKITGIVGFYHDKEGNFFWSYDDDNNQVMLKENLVNKNTTEYELNKNKKFVLNKGNKQITIGLIENGVIINGVLVSKDFISYIEPNVVITYKIDESMVEFKNKEEKTHVYKLNVMDTDEKRNLLVRIKEINEKFSSYLADTDPNLLGVKLNNQKS